jgi:hypothetical protein
MVRRYLDRDPVGEEGDTPHTVSDLVTGLIRANFRIDTLLEPAPRAGGAGTRDWTPAMAWMPSTLVIRARKEGT